MWEADAMYLKSPITSIGEHLKAISQQSLSTNTFKHSFLSLSVFCTTWLSSQSCVVWLMLITATGSVKIIKCYKYLSCTPNILIADQLSHCKSNYRVWYMQILETQDKCKNTINRVQSLINKIWGPNCFSFNWPSSGAFNIKKITLPYVNYLNICVSFKIDYIKYN